MDHAEAAGRGVSQDEAADVELLRALHGAFSGNLHLHCAGRCAPPALSCCQKDYLVMLLPGEEIVLAGLLCMEPGTFERDYLLRITWRGRVLKAMRMDRGCVALDRGCRLGAAKPLICKLYPMVPTMRGGSVVLELDSEPCNGGDCCPLAREGGSMMDAFAAEVRAVVGRFPLPAQWIEPLDALDPPDSRFYDFVRMYERFGKKDQYSADELAAVGTDVPPVGAVEEP